jgi:hypothetical protein
VLAVTTTSDGYVLIGVRSPSIDWPLLRHVVPAGRLRPIELDPYTGITVEFHEELGLTPEDIIELECIGVVADQTWGRLNIEFVFRAKTRLTAREVLDRAKAAKSVSEHCQLEPFPWQGSLIRDLLFADPNGYVPTGWAGLAVAIQRDFGENEFPDWTPVHRSYADHLGRRLRMCHPAVLSEASTGAPQHPEIGSLFDGMMAYWIHQDQLLWERANTLIAVQAGLFTGAYALSNRPRVMASLLLAGAVLSLALFLVMLRHVAHRDANDVVMHRIFGILADGSPVAGEALMLGAPWTCRAPVKASYILRGAAIFFILFDVYLAGLFFKWWPPLIFFGPLPN